MREWNVGRGARLAVSVVAGGLLAGCGASTKLTSTWSSPSFNGITPQRVVVLALSPDMERQRAYEAGFAKAADKESYVVIQGADLLGPWPSEGIKSKVEEVRATLKAANVDAVVTIGFVGKEQDTTYVPGGFYYGPAWGGYYMDYWNTYDAGYWETSTTYTVEARLFDSLEPPPEGQPASTGAVWVTQGKVMDPVDDAQGGASFGKAMVESLRSSGAFLSTD